MRRAASITSVALLLAGGGCVQQDKYDNTVRSSRSLQEQLVAAEQDRDTAQANLEEVRRQLAQARSTNDALQGQVNTVDGDLQTQARQYDDLLRRVSQLEFGPLPADLEDALANLAAGYPELISFDPDHGMLRFSSDFTFDLGSAALKPEAADTIAMLADILGTNDAASFELRVIGHTDNVPVEKPSTLRLHPSNVHLSVHRAIAVRDAMVQAGVEPARIQVAGYGEFRPIVPNGAKGAAENRRVELVLVPQRSAAPIVQQPTAMPEPMK